MADSEVIYMTSQEVELLDKRIAALEDSIRDANFRLSEARKEGDLRENEEYSSAENDLFRFKKELAEKKARRQVAQVVNFKSKNAGRITEGSTISLRIGEREFHEVTFTSNNVIPFKSISTHSRLGTLLMGRGVGDVFDYVDNVFRQQTVTILEVR